MRALFNPLLVPVSLCVLLAACGGGGGGKSTATTSTPVATSSTTSSSTTTSAAATSTSSAPATSTSSASSSSAGSSAYNAGVANLKALAVFPVGVAVSYGSESYSYTNSPAQQAVIKQHFSQLTAGNIMKMSYLHPAENTFNFTQADDLLKFATDNGMTLHAHTMIWHSDYQVPNWMKNYAGDKAAWLAMLKNHVQGLGWHLYSWNFPYRN